jgi:hypothetical protein
MACVLAVQVLQSPAQRLQAGSACSGRPRNQEMSKC